MAYQLPIDKKLALVMRWPAKLDQELRRKFGDALQPKTGFNKETNRYATEFNHGDDPAVSSEVLMFIEGFQTAISTLTE